MSRTSAPATTARRSSFTTLPSTRPRSVCAPTARVARVPPSCGLRSRVSRECSVASSCACVACADIWSTGCMLGELLLGHPLFPGETSADQIEQIARIMGPPSEKEVRVCVVTGAFHE